VSEWIIEENIDFVMSNVHLLHVYLYLFTPDVSTVVQMQASWIVVCVKWFGEGDREC
jgi:hypothetical protein